MMLKTLYRWTRTLVNARNAQHKPSLLPSTKHLETEAVKTNHDIRRFMYERLKASDIVEHCKSKFGTVVLVTSMKLDHIAVNAYCLTKGNHSGDFVSLRDVRRNGHGGAVLYRNSIYTIEGLARKMGGWSIQGNPVDYGYFELSPFASFKMPLSETELIWVRESLERSHVDAMNRAPYYDRCA